MIIRRIRIWYSRGWYRTLCSISLLLLPLFCNTGKAYTSPNHVQQVPPDVSVMYGVPVNRFVVSDDPAQVEASAPKYPLIILDGKIVSVIDDKLSEFDFGAPIFDRYKLADLVGIRGDKIKAVQILNNKAAEKIWGDKGAGGSLEILTRKYYRKALKAGKLSGHYQPVTSLKNRNN